MGRPVGSDEGVHYMICRRHLRAALAQYEATRHLGKAGRSSRGRATERARIHAA
jgi:hypothetical protein